MTEEELKEKMLELAEANGLQPTENFDRIVKAKMRFGIGLGCPCDRNSERACISDKCKQDIERDGICHCRCYTKK